MIIVILYHVALNNCVSFVKFGIKTNIKNTDVLLDVNDDGICKRPVFCHPKFVIETTFRKSDDPNGEKDSTFGMIKTDTGYELYTKTTKNTIGYRKQVLWDFGDGTQIEGYSAKHAYTRPGKYKITCILFDIDRKGYENEYSINVIVKEIIPTMLSFDQKASSKTAIKCSKPERIARVHATLANTVKDELLVCARRVFKNEPTYHENTYWEIRNSEFPNLQKYYAFLEKKSDYYYGTEDVYADELVPVTAYTPKYDEIIGEFVANETNGKSTIGVKLYKYSIFKKSPEQENIDILDPNCDITKGEQWLSTPVKKVYESSEFSDDCTVFGKRGIIDVFYKSDYISAKTKISLFFNVEGQDFDRNLKSSVNYTNVLPLGLNFSVLQNNPKDAYWCITLNGFIHKPEDKSWEEFSQESIEDYCKHSLFKNRKLPCVLIPYIPLESDVLKVKDSDYYIPKDLSMMVKCTTAGGTDSEVLLVPSKINELKYLRYFLLDLKSTINAAIEVYGTGKDFGIYINDTFSKNGDKLTLRDLNDIIVPKEKMIHQDIDALIECYFPHPMFKDTPMMKSFFKSILETNEAFDNILTRSGHFVDDTVHYKTSYIHNLLSLLISLNEDISSYEWGDFTGVYELRDFTRLLSMNYSDLVGNIYSKEYDFYVDDSYKGVNLGNKIKIGETIKINKEGSIIADAHETYDADDKTQLVVIDDYTGNARIINFSSYVIHEWDKIKDSDEIEIKIGRDYNVFWNWNLLIPNQYKELTLKYPLTEEEITEKERAIDNHYTFYIFDETKNKRYINNFIRESDVINAGGEDDFHDKWFDKWGIPYDSLYKIIDQSLSLNSVGENDEDEQSGRYFTDTPYSITLSMKFSENNTKVDIVDIFSKYIYCAEYETVANKMLADIKGVFNARVKIDWGDTTKTSVYIKELPELIDAMKHTYTEKGEYLISVSLTGSLWDDEGGTMVTNNGEIIDAEIIKHISTYYGLVAESQNQDGSITNLVFLPNKESKQEDEMFPLTIYTLEIN